MHDLSSLFVRYMVFVKGKRGTFDAAYRFVAAWCRLNHYLFLWLGKNETVFFETINQKRDLRLFSSLASRALWIQLRNNKTTTLVITIEIRKGVSGNLESFDHRISLDNLEHFDKLYLKQRYDINLLKCEPSKILQGLHKS